MHAAATTMLTDITFSGPRDWARRPPFDAKRIIGMVKRLSVSPMSQVSAPRSRSSSDHKASNIPMVR